MLVNGWGVPGGWPSDCPAPCAWVTPVDAAGRATHVTGDPEHPVTAGFLCGKVSNYLDRVYAEDRLLHLVLALGEYCPRIPPHPELLRRQPAHAGVGAAHLFGIGEIVGGRFSKRRRGTRDGREAWARAECQPAPVPPPVPLVPRVLPE